MAGELQKLFEGSWTNYNSENFDKFLDKMGVGMIKKKMASTVKPTVTVKVEGETITVSNSVGIKTNSVSFKLDTPFDFETEMAGTGVASFNGSVWTIQVTPKDPKKGKAQTITREIIKGELVQTMVVEDVTCKRYFKKS